MAPRKATSATRIPPPQWRGVALWWPGGARRRRRRRRALTVAGGHAAGGGRTRAAAPGQTPSRGFGDPVSGGGALPVRDLAEVVGSGPTPLHGHRRLAGGTPRRRASSVGMKRSLNPPMRPPARRAPTGCAISPIRIFAARTLNDAIAERRCRAALPARPPQEPAAAAAAARPPRRVAAVRTWLERAQRRAGDERIFRRCAARSAPRVAASSRGAAAANAKSGGRTAQLEAPRPGAVCPSTPCPTDGAGIGGPVRRHQPSVEEQRRGAGRFARAPRRSVSAPSRRRLLGDAELRRASADADGAARARLRGRERPDAL